MRLAIASNVRCATGSKVLALIEDEAGIEFGDSTHGEQWCTVRIPQDHPAASVVANKRVFQVEDAETRPEYRIEKVHDSLVSGMVQVDAAPVLLDLAKIQIYQTLGGVERHVITAHELTREQWIDNYALPALTAAGITWVARGTITPTGKLSLTLDHQTVLGLLRELVAGTTSEVILRRNGDTNYLIDLVRLNATAIKPMAIVGQNVTALERDTSTEQLVTVAKPTGITPSGALERATVAGTVLKVTARSGTSVTLVDPRDSGDAIAGDDHLNGLYLTRPATIVAGHTSYAAWVAYSVLKDRLYVFDATTFYYGHEVHPGTGEVVSYLSNSVFSGDGTGISAVCYVPKGTSGKIWIWTNGGATILELDCAAHTVATVRASGAVTPHTRPIYHSGQDAVYYVNGSNVHKYLAVSPFTASSFAIGNTCYGMAWVSSVSLFYLATNVASPAFRTYDPATDAFASITPTGAGTYRQVEFDSTADRIIASDDADNGGFRIHLINPAGTDTITNTLQVVQSAGQGGGVTLDWGDTTTRQWSLAGGGFAWFIMKDSLGGRWVAQVDVAGATAVQLDNAVLGNQTQRFVAYDSDRGLMYGNGGGCAWGLNPSQGCWESKVLINDTVDASNQVVVANKEKLFEAGTLVGLARNATGTRLTTMPHSGGIAQYGVSDVLLNVSAFRGERQLVRDPFSNEWLSAIWPKHLSHWWNLGRYQNGALDPEIRATWSEYPASVPLEHAFQADGAHTAPTKIINLKAGPLSTVIPVGARIFNSGQYLLVRKRAVTNGSGVVTLEVYNALVTNLANNDAVTVHVPPLGTTPPNGVATYTQWAAIAGDYLGRWSLVPAAIPSQHTPSEWHTVRFRFGGFWRGRPSELFSFVFGGVPGNFGAATLPFSDDYDYPEGVRFVEVTLSGRRTPGLHFDGIRINGSTFHNFTRNLLVLDRVGVMQNVEPGASGSPPFTEYSHANQLWRVGKEMLDVGRTPQIDYELEVVETDARRPFILGAHVDLRDSERGIFTTAPRISNRRFVELTRGGTTLRRPILTVDTRLPTLAHLAAGPPPELSGGGSPEDVPPVPDSDDPVDTPAGDTDATAVTDILEATAPDQSASGVTFYDLNPIPFNTVSFLRGTRLSLTGPGRVAVTEAGMYEVKVVLGITGASDMTHCLITATSGEGTPDGRWLWQTFKSSDNLAVVLSLTGMLRCGDTDEIDFYVEASRAVAGVIEFDSLIVSVIRLGGIPAV